MPFYRSTSIETGRMIPYYSTAAMGRLPMSIDLNDSLTAAWTFNGDINDQAGSNNLTVSGTETYYSSSAFQFDGSTYLSHANSTALQAPDKFTIAVVFHCAGNGVLVGKFTDLSTDREYILRRYTEEGTPYLNFTVDNQAVLISDAVNTDNTYLAIAWNDPSDAIAGQGLWVQNLNGDPATESTTNGATALLGTSDFYVGGYSGFQIASDTRIDALYYWKGRVLNGDERAALFNNGTPIEYPFS